MGLGLGRPRHRDAWRRSALRDDDDDDDDDDAVWYARARDGRWNDVCVDDDERVVVVVGGDGDGDGDGSHAVAHDEGE